MVEHDPSASQATFVEISFGINLLWAAFERFRDLFKKALTAKMEAEIAAVKTLETKASNQHSPEWLKSLKHQVGVLDASHLKFQESMLHLAKILTIIAAIACVAILYFDLIGWLGKWLGLLLIPLPGYLLAAAAGFYYVKWGIFKLVRKYTEFIKQFELTPQTIKEDLESFDEPPSGELPPDEPPK
jgi:hypothetical protein